MENMKKSRTQKNKPHRTAITVSEAIGAFELAFRTNDPNEVEQLLREMLNVQVAVVDSKEKAENLLNSGKKFNTVSVPYGLFLDKIRDVLRGKQEGGDEANPLYSIESSSITGGNFKYVLKPVYSSELVMPGKTYVLLSSIAGYSSSEGLTFMEAGSPTGFEDQPEAEQREKLGEGYFQLLKDHMEGVWRYSGEIAEIYSPFIKAWAKHALAPQWREDINGEHLDNFVKKIIWAMRVSTLLHDIGKLNKKWQDAVWENEEKIRGERSEPDKREFIARTSPIIDEKLRKEIKKPPSHAPFAYPFLRTFLRYVLGDFRFLDNIALASARHHSLDVAGTARRETFNKEKAEKFLEDCLPQLLQIGEEDKAKILDAIRHSLSATQRGSEADEPPSPSDDFYFLYCLTNRMVKLCDWEDAGKQIIELTSLRKQ